MRIGADGCHRSKLHPQPSGRYTPETTSRRRQDIHDGRQEGFGRATTARGIDAATGVSTTTIGMSLMDFDCRAQNNCCEKSEVHDVVCLAQGWLMLM